MKIAIYGAGCYGRYMYDEIANHENSKIVVSFWIDNYIEEKEIYSLPVYTENEFVSERMIDTVDAVVIAIENADISQKVIVSLLSQGYNQIYAVLPNSYKTQIPLLDDIGNFTSCVRYYKDIRPTIEFMEILVNHQCNLNCKRCAHFSNLNTEKEFLDLDEYESYLIQLRNKFENIRLFQLIGGEPLLNPNLDLCVHLARKYLPCSRLEIATNGLLLLKMPQKLIDAIVHCNVFLYITQYPPTREKVLQIVDFLEKERINYQFTIPTTHFEKILTLKEENGEKTYKKYRTTECVCHGVEDGRIYLCPSISRLYSVQEYFNMHIEKEELINSSVDLMNDDVDGWDILQYFNHPTPLCRFCSPERESLLWETGQPKKEDWINTY